MKQRSLSSFFSGDKKKKAAASPTSDETKENHALSSDAAAAAAAAATADSQALPAENQPRLEAEESDDDDAPVGRKRAKEPSVKRRKLVIDDDDEEDESEPGVDTKMSDAIEKQTSEQDLREDAVRLEEEMISKDTNMEVGVVTNNEGAVIVASKSETALNNGAAATSTDTSKVMRQTSLTASRKSSNNNGILKALKDVPKNDELTVDWEAGSQLPYSALCTALTAIEGISSRLQIQEILTTLFRKLLVLNHNHSDSSSISAAADDLLTVCYLASNSVAPAYKCVELGIGDAILIKAIGEATGTAPKLIKERYEAQGDLGLVAESCKSKQKTLGGFFQAKPAASVNGTATGKKLLTAKEVLEVFRTIATTKGSQSQKFKVEAIKKVLTRVSSPVEIRYIVRGLQGKLRIGLAQSTVLISLAHAFALTPPAFETSKIDQSAKDRKVPEMVLQYLDKSLTPEKRLEAAVSIIRKAYNEYPSYEKLIEGCMKVPLELLHRECTLTPGVPVTPMLAKPTKSIQEVLKRLNGLRFTCEFKYDGERAQVHLLPGGTATKVFSRNLLDTSEKYPEVPLYVKEAMSSSVDSFVMDAEVVAFNQETGKLVPFQILSTRKKTEESADTAKVQVIVEAFDLMYLNGESLLDKTLAERRALLFEHFRAVEGKFKFAELMDHQENGDTIVIEEFLDAAVKGQCEGLMVKTLDVNAVYEPSKRSLNWLKLKKDYLQGLGDSVDLVPLGAYHGRGKRTGVYGAYLLACYDPDTEEFQSVCKVGTGFSDEALKSLSDLLNKHLIPQKSSQYNVSDQLECDVWFDAVQVWEVKAADMSKSSAHRGASGKTGEEGRGIGLRFPRFERVREDKNPEDATTSDQILDMYWAQDTVNNEDENGDDDDGI
ncbi:hypothetical protein MPSEU_000446700 [Mayamaea pseudoterrestris]|nr:hypothetical protein MPSEU_000446700 [Mayamaea pseudoterrestris]